MNNFEKLSVTLEKYNYLKSIQIANGAAISEQILGSRRKLYSRGMLLCVTSETSPINIGNISPQKFTSFLGMFSRTLYHQMHKNQDLYDLKIKFDGFTRSRNMYEYKLIRNGHMMYNIDLSSAYWQVAYRLGYISKSVYDKYMYVDEYKVAKRFCVSFLARRNSKQYTAADGTKIVIACDNVIFKNIYANIRNALYTIVKELISDVPWISYNIDAVLVPKSSLAIIEKKLKKQNLIYKITNCQKLNENEFRSGSVIKKIKK